MSAEMSILIRAKDEASKVFQSVQSAGSESANWLKQNWKQVGLAFAGVGAGIEALARKQAPLTEQTRNLAAALDMQEDEVRELATSMSDVTFPIEDVLDLMEIGRQRGLESADALEQYAGFWDMVGDATGESATKLAESGVALQGIGIAAGEEGEALAAFGYITRETTQDVGEFLRFIDRAGPELREMGMDVDDTAAIIGILENEFGMASRTARQEFRTAVNESGGDLQAMYEILGITEDQVQEYSKAVQDSSGVIEEQAANHEKSYTVIQRLQARVGDLIYEYGGLLEVGGQIAPMFMAAVPVIKGVTSMTGGLTAAKGALAAAKAALLGPIGLVVAALAGLTLGIKYLWENNEGFRNFVISAWTQIQEVGKTVWEGLIDTISRFVEFFREAWDDNERIVEAAIETWQHLVERAKSEWEQLQNVIATVLEAIWAVIEGTLNNIQEFWNTWGESIMIVAQTVWEQIKIVVETALAVIQEVILAVLAVIRGDWESAWEHILAAGQQIWEGIQKTIENVFTGIKDFLAEVWSTTREQFSEAWQHIYETGRQMWDDITRQMNEFLGTILDIARDIYDGVTGYFGDLYSSALSVAQDLVSGVIELFSDLYNSVTDAVQSAYTSVTDTFESLQSTVVSSVQGLVNDVVSWFSDLPGRVMEQVNSMVDSVTGAFSGLFRSLVGGSIVPDMMEQIEQEFQSGMEGSSQAVEEDSAEIEGEFDDLKGTVSDSGGIVPEMMGDIEEEIGSGMGSSLQAVEKDSADIEGEFDSLKGNVSDSGGIVPKMMSDIEEEVTSGMSDAKQTIASEGGKWEEEFKSAASKSIGKVQSELDKLEGIITNAIQEGQGSVSAIKIPVEYEIGDAPSGSDFIPGTGGVWGEGDATLPDWGPDTDYDTIVDIIDDHTQDTLEDTWEWEYWAGYTDKDLDEWMEDKGGHFVDEDNIPGYDRGGVVPGPRGAPRFIMAHGGETILPTHKQGYGGDFRDLAKAIANEIAKLVKPNLTVYNEFKPDESTPSKHVRKQEQMLREFALRWEMA